MTHNARKSAKFNWGRDSKVVTQKARNSRTMLAVNRKIREELKGDHTRSNKTI